MSSANTACICPACGRSTPHGPDMSINGITQIMHHLYTSLHNPLTHVEAKIKCFCVFIYFLLFFAMQHVTCVYTNKRRRELLFRSLISWETQAMYSIHTSKRCALWRWDFSRNRKRPSWLGWRPPTLREGNVTFLLKLCGVPTFLHLSRSFYFHFISSFIPLTHSGLEFWTRLFDKLEWLP